jgi:endonuclease III
LKVHDRLKGVIDHAQATHRKLRGNEYPPEILDLIIFHKIHLYLDEKTALQSFRRLKTNFVDWNEVRISSLPEIQEALAQAPSSLGVAVFIKDFLDYLHSCNQTMDLEFLAEENITEIRKFLRLIRSMNASTVSMVLRMRKEYPVLPIDSNMEPALVRMGLVKKTDNRDQKGRFLHTVVEADSALAFHHFLIEHARETCPPEDDDVQCPTCELTKCCQFFEKGGSRRKKPAKATKAAAAIRTKAPAAKTKSSKKTAVKKSAGAKKATAAKRATAAKKSAASAGSSRKSSKKPSKKKTKQPAGKVKTRK